MAKEEDVLLFHSSDYVACLQTLSTDEDPEKYEEEAEMFGLSKFHKGYTSYIDQDVNCNANRPV